MWRILDFLLYMQNMVQISPIILSLLPLISPCPHKKCYKDAFIYFGVLRHFQHCTGHITTGSWKGRGNQYIQFTRVLYCKLPTNGKQLPAFPLKAMTGIEPRPQRWEARVLPLCHRGPYKDAFIRFRVCVNTDSLTDKRMHPKDIL